MPSALRLGPVVDLRLGPALIATLLVLSVALLFSWRRDALRHGADPSRHAWFAFAIRVQLMLTLGWCVGPAVTMRAQPAVSLALLFPPLLPLLPILGPASLFALPVAISLAAVLVAGDVERRLRGAGWTARERLSQLALALAVGVLPIAGLLAASVLLARGAIRAAVACALGGFVVALWLAGRNAAMLGLKPEAATSGPLRDRLFELAARARVRVRQVYVLSAARAKLANAFAVRAGSILLTDHLLAHLSRREVDAVIAHELTHLRHRHPAKLGAAFGVPFALGLVAAALALGSRFTSFGMAGLVGAMSLRWWARRFEYQADRGAAQLTGDAPALITALVRIARLNAMPVDWSRAEEWVLTHPSVRRRALALATAGQLSATEANALVDAPPDDPERWSLPVAEREPVFGTPAKRARAAATTWSLLLAGAMAPAAALALLRITGGAMPWPATFALVVAASLAATLATIDIVATAGYAACERSLAERRGRSPGDAGFVGLAPGEGGMTYEGFADWDLGYLDLDPIALRYDGERARFALERERIVSIELVPGLPGWFPSPRVAVRWRAADGAVHAFSIRDGRARTLHEIAARSRRLLHELRQWHAQSAPAGVHAIGGGEPPRPDAVTGTTHAELASARRLLPVLPVLAAVGLLASLAAGLPLTPGRGPGAFEVMGAGLITVVALRAPLWRAAHARRKPAPAPRSVDHEHPAA
jgi:Zn-dependent protease with chaperone function